MMNERRGSLLAPLPRGMIHNLHTANKRNFRSIRTSAYLSSAYLSSQTSSMRQPLKMLLTITVSPFTRGCQHVAPRP